MTPLEYAKQIDLQIETARVARQDAYTAVQDLHRQLSTAEESQRKTESACKATERYPLDLAHALAWTGPQIQTREITEYGQTRFEAKACFAWGRALVSRGYSGSRHAPRAEATIQGFAKIAGTQTLATWSAPQGTNNPDKLADQLSDACAWLRESLEEYTAVAWLQTQGISDPSGPITGRLLDYLTVEGGAKVYHYSRGPFCEPLWTFKIGSLIVLEIRGELLTRAEDNLPPEDRAKLYPYDSTSEAAVRDYCSIHHDRALRWAAEHFDGGLSRKGD